MEKYARTASPGASKESAPAQTTRARRVPFAAELLATDLNSGNEVWGETENLSGGGCYVRTGQSFAQGTLLRIEIRNHGACFLTDATVAYVMDRKGMGLSFLNIPASQRAILEDWLLSAGARELAESSKQGTD